MKNASAGFKTSTELKREGFLVACHSLQRVVGNLVGEDFFVSQVEVVTTVRELGQRARQT